MTNKKPHPEDIRIAGRIATAVSFKAFLLVGPGKRFWSDEVPTYEEAKDAAAALVAEHSRFGRGAVVYAILPNGSCEPCSDFLIELARAA